ncbi:MAG: F0F1 ATP synthase subunit delta [Lachnospiraceae bacterium]|nr:F0F1 ATP synthase subunit delta [Lachnospiraceae bacterium]
MAKLVSKTYGDALFEVAVENGAIDSMMEEVEAVQGIFQENEDYVRLLNHPKIPVEEKHAIMKDAFDGKISNELMGLFTTVVEKGRFSEIEGILAYFLEEVREYKRIGSADVVSAKELSGEERAGIEKKLLETTSYQSFQMNYRVDASLIGGMMIRIGDRVVDSSIRTKLNNMAKDLSKLQITNI